MSSTKRMHTEDENEALKEEITRLKAKLKAYEDMSPLLDCSDVTLLIEGKAIRAHRAILSRSPVLAALLEPHDEFEITDTKLAIFEVLLRYLYTDQVPLQKGQAATELMTAAEDYELDGLKTILKDQRDAHEVEREDVVDDSITFTSTEQSLASQAASRFKCTFKWCRFNGKFENIVVDHVRRFHFNIDPNAPIQDQMAHDGYEEAKNHVRPMNV